MPGECGEGEGSRVSLWDEKMAPPARPTDSVPRRSLESLRKHVSYRVLDGPPETPTLVALTIMGVESRWRRTQGKSAGVAHVYEGLDRGTTAG